MEFKLNQYLVLILGWAAYYFLHSWLASTPVKKVLATRYYRLIYTLFSVAGLFALLMLNGSIASPYLLPTEGTVRYISLVFASFGVIIIRISFKHYSFKTFVGLSPDQDQRLQQDGILQHVRHPLYSGTILILLGFFLFNPNWPTLVSVICSFAYLPIGIYLEEQKLITHYGKTYLEYRERVPALLPRFWK